jgi:transcriptional regulator with XRE-family HTH domain
MFQKNIKYLLNTKQLSVETILRLTGHKSKSIVSMWKSGERYIITEDAVKLANYLNITIDDLINKDLSQIQVSNDFKDYFNNNLHLLTDEDKDMIKFIIEKRVKK